MTEMCSYFNLESLWEFTGITVVQLNRANKHQYIHCRGKKVIISGVDLELLQLVRSKPSGIFFFPWWLRNIVKKLSMRTYECQGAWGVIFTHELATTPQCPDFTPLKLFGMCWKRKDWKNGSTLVINTNLSQKYMQIWMEINVVILHKVVEIMPQQMLYVIKAKDSQNKY